MDLFKIFRHKCFHCRETENLLKVAHPGYHTTYTYYHQNCLDKVLKDPEGNQFYLDSAIQIMDQIRKDNEARQSKLRANLQKIQVVRNLSNTMVKTVEKVVEQKIEKAVENIKKHKTKIEFINKKE